MENFSTLFKQTATYQILRLFLKQIIDFFETFGDLGKDFFLVFKYIIKGDFHYKAFIEQAKRFSIDSLPITISIVAMSSIIVSIQVAPEMAKQGGLNYFGMLLALVMVREMGVIMAGFAIISMIGSAFASEVATMKVTDQIDALKVLKVQPIKYLFVPRVLAGTVMMPIIVTVAMLLGVLAGGASVIMGKSDLSWLNFINSVWFGLNVRDIFISLFKSSCFGAAIALVSCACGFEATGGAKGVGIATTKAVVWSFITIAIIDLIFAAVFYM